jgi:probable rRNA maturation factor
VTRVSVEVTVSCDAWLAACPDAEALAQEAAGAALADASADPERLLVLGIVLSDDIEQRDLNRTYRGQDKPTNVLSFALCHPGAALPAGAPLLLGDVVLALETVAREAAEQGKPLRDHLRHLVVHGVLHILGLNHEEAVGAAVMEGREVAILRALGVPDPYRDTM